MNSMISMLLRPAHLFGKIRYSDRTQRCYHHSEFQRYQPNWTGSTLNEKHDLYAPTHCIITTCQTSHLSSLTCSCWWKNNSQQPIICSMKANLALHCSARFALSEQTLEERCGGSAYSDRFNWLEIARYVIIDPHDLDGACRNIK